VRFISGFVLGPETEILSTVDVAMESAAGLDCRSRRITMPKEDSDDIDEESDVSDTIDVYPRVIVRITGVLEQHPE